MLARRIMYAIRGEKWRINAMMLVQDLYRSLPGFKPDLGRVIGLLLGYDPDEIEHYIKSFKRK